MFGKSTTYVAYIEEVVKDNQDQYTFGLRIRVPSLHGLKETSNIKTQDLPIAYPLLIPGAAISKTTFENEITKMKTVLVIFRDNKLQYPYYFGFPNAERGDPASVDFDILDGGTF